MQENVSAIINGLTVAAGLALFVERSLEGIKHLLDIAYARPKDDHGEQLAFLERRREHLRGITDEINRTAEGDQDPGEDRAETLDINALDDEQREHQRIRVEPINPFSVENSAYVLFLSLVAVGMGIIVAELANIHLVSLFFSEAKEYRHADVILSGIVIGGGSHSIHELIRFLTTRRVPQAVTGNDVEVQAAPVAKVARTPVPQASSTDGEWKTIPYSGGVRPETLEYRNLRRSDPDLIVYHHTAMHSRLPFKAVVDEFLVSKKWSTGYHCVVMPDGTIEPFCRWDRCGNHAKSVNHRSLGIAFHGNFETVPGGKYSNHDGRFGVPVPTAAQVESGARAIALWMHLYDIPLDFEKTVIPHKAVIRGHTDCPGSNFPYEELRERIAYYWSAWKDSQDAVEQLTKFRNKPYLFTKAGA